MASSAIRFKNAGTGSAQPADPQVDPFTRLFDIVHCIKTQKFREKPLPWNAAENGLPCFRPGGDSGLQILDPEKEAWYDFLTWWLNRYPDQMDAYNYAVTKATEALNSLPGAGSEAAMLYNFCVCLPCIAGNIVLHQKNSPFRLHNPPRLHVYPWWYASSWQQPLTVSARWENLNCDLKPSNRLAVFWERLSTLASQWDGSEQVPDFASAIYADIGGNIYENGHPWPVGENVSGLVPITGAMSRAVLPIAHEGDNLVFAVDNWMLADDLGGEGMALFDCKPDANYVPTEMFAVWENINPARAALVTSERTPVNVLPTPDSTSGPYLCGRYCDRETGEVIIIKCSQVHYIGGTAFDDGTEQPEITFSAAGDVGAEIGSIPFGHDYAHGGTAWNFAVPVITPDYASRRLRLVRTMSESVMPAYEDGPIIEIEVNTGTGGDYASVKNTATVQFYCDGYPNILPVGDTPEAEISVEGGLITIKVKYSDYFEKDGMGAYYGYQRKKFRYVITRLDYTWTFWTLYPQTLSAIGQASGPPEDPGEYIGY